MHYPDPVSKGFYAPAGLVPAEQQIKIQGIIYKPDRRRGAPDTLRERLVAAYETLSRYVAKWVVFVLTSAQFRGC